MTDLSPLIQFYIAANVMLIVAWCFLMSVTFILRKLTLGTSHKRLLQISRILFLSVLLSPLIGELNILQDNIVEISTINDGIHEFREVFLTDSTRVFDIDLSVIKIGLKKGASAPSLFDLLMFVFLFAFVVRGLTVFRSLFRLSDLIQKGYPWKTSGKLQILVSEQIRIPFSTFALGKYHIVVPISMLSMPHDLKLTIRHEGIHHLHGDTKWLLFMEVIKQLYYINPFVYFWGRSFETLQENACDEAVIKQSHISLVKYSDCLIRMCQSIVDFNPKIMAVSSIFKKPAFPFNQKNCLERRIKMMSHQHKIRFPIFRVFALVIPFLAVVLALPPFLNLTLFAEDGGGVSNTLAPPGISPKVQKRKFPTLIPVTGKLTSPFGERLNPFTNKKELHKGIDISNVIGTPIVSTLDGTVVFAGFKAAYGLRLDITHGDNIETHYSNLSKILVKVGESVTRGQKVALLGNSGRSTGPHLHYELLVDGQKVDPLAYLKDF